MVGRTGGQGVGWGEGEVRAGRGVWKLLEGCSVSVWKQSRNPTLDNVNILYQRVNVKMIMMIF